jgi:Protein of unknown function (DUF1501)
MLTIWGPGRAPFCDGLTRRNFLTVGTLSLGGLSLAELLKQRAQGAVAATAPSKSVIMVYLPGGPSHIDLYDMKPDAPVEIRGEFKPIRTKVPGIDLCELMPLQTRIADKLSIIRGFQTGGNHESQTLTTGFRPRAHRPAFGSVVSRLRPNQGPGLPPYVTLIQESNLPFGQDPEYLGPGHKPFSLRGQGMADLTLGRAMTLDRLEDRAELRHRFDTMRRDLDVRGELAGMDDFTARALAMVTSSKTREAFDLTREPLRVREKYGSSPGTLQFLLARRLVEAGVRVVTLCGGWANDGRGDSSSNITNWDTHEDNFNRLRVQAPQLDRALYALIDDLCQRGLAEDVVVVACGEMGRSPRVGRSNDGGNASATGRDHWPTGFALVAGGGLRMGQVVGATDRRGERARGTPFTPQNLLATLYHVLGIDPLLTFPDHTGRPQYLLEDRAAIAPLL